MGPINREIRCYVWFNALSGLQIRFNVHSRLQIWRNGDHRIANPMKLDPMKLGMGNDLRKRNESFDVNHLMT